MATPDDFNQLVRPVVWRTGNAEYPYWGKGSLFIVEYKDRWFLITAKHVLRDGNPDDLCIFPRDDIRDTLPLKTLFKPTSREIDDTDHRDIHILEIDRNKIIGQDAENIHALNFGNSYRSPASVAEGARLLAIGIPKFEVDYETKTIKFVRFQCLGSFKGSTDYLGCYEMGVDSNQVADDKSVSQGKMKLETLDGFSGCPVYANVSDKSGTFSPRIVGMALRGTIESGKLFFLGSNLIKELLDKTTVA
jgi:hypothetical protein